MSHPETQGRQRQVRVNTQRIRLNAVHVVDDPHNDVISLASNRISGLPIDTVQWDLCSLPIRTSSVDIIITDMPFGKR